MASDLMGTSDIGRIIEPQDYDKTDLDDYIFHEDGEKIFFLIKAKTDEYCFTNVAFIHLDGQSATSKKRLLKRYPYRNFQPANIMIETAGTMDMDAELKFSLGGMAFSIDIDKNQIEQIRDIYKALTAISEQCKRIAHEEMVLEKSFNTVTNMFSLRELSENVVLNLPDVINQTVAQVENAYGERLKTIPNYDFGEIFEHYLRQ